MSRSYLGSNNYKNTSFQEDLDTSDKLVDVTVEALKEKYKTPKYEVLGSFDASFDGVISDFTLEERTEMQHILSKRFKDNVEQESNKYIDFLQTGLTGKEDSKIGMRSFDVAVRDTTTNKIVELVECKDFPQLVFFNKTGLPAFYLKKLELLTKVIGRQQNDYNIKTSVVFTDTPTFIENFSKKAGEMPYLEKLKKSAVVENNGQFIPYCFPLDDFLKQDIATNKNGKVIPSYFIKKNWNTHPEANNQFLLDINKSKHIDDFNGFKQNFIVDNTILSSVINDLDDKQATFINNKLMKLNNDLSPLLNFSKIILESFENKYKGLDYILPLKKFLTSLKAKECYKWNAELKRAGINLDNGTLTEISFKDYSAINKFNIKKSKQNNNYSSHR
ncbi:hypothetical protein HOK00_09590 [bacterium]|nr:hypothetical protein [bacterium]